MAGDQFGFRFQKIKIFSESTFVNRLSGDLNAFGIVPFDQKLTRLFNVGSKSLGRNSKD